VAGAWANRGVHARHPSDAGTGAARGVLPRVPVRGHRAHGHPAACADRRANACHPVLAYQSEVSYGAAAPYALVTVALAALPAVVLALWFDRNRGAQPQLAPL